MMGKQRTRIVKRKARKIYDKIPAKFTMDFQENKEILKELDLPVTKVNRNIMAGYIIQLVEKEGEI